MPIQSQHPPSELRFPSRGCGSSREIGTHVAFTGAGCDGDCLLTLPQVPHPVPLDCGIPGLAFLSSPKLKAGKSSDGRPLMSLHQSYLKFSEGQETRCHICCPRAVSKNDEILSMIIGLTSFIANMATMTKSCERKPHICSVYLEHERSGDIWQGHLEGHFCPCSLPCPRDTP